MYTYTYICTYYSFIYLNYIIFYAIFKYFNINIIPPKRPIAAHKCVHLKKLK